MIPSATTTTSTTGFSLSPGGLLLPYHVGALEALEHYQQLTPETPIAGSSAGSIAVAAHACGVDSKQVLETTAQIADACTVEGGTRGRLLSKLRSSLNDIITDEQYQQLQNRPGAVTIAYQEIFPFYRSRHQTEFEDRDDLVNAICHSSTFPFFTTKWPCVLDTSRRVPRLVVDGFFAVPRDRFGCPDFEMAQVGPVDRTVLISCFPQETMGIGAAKPQDCISPVADGKDNQLQELFRLATQSATRQEYAAVYENGWKDAERWCQEHADAYKKKEQPLEQQSAMQRGNESTGVSAGF